MAYRDPDDDIQIIVPPQGQSHFHRIQYHHDHDDDDIIVIPTASPRSVTIEHHSDTEDLGFYESYDISTWDQYEEDESRLRVRRSRSLSRPRSGFVRSDSWNDQYGGKRLTSQKQFHKQSNFVRARYPSNMVKSDRRRPTTANDTQKKYKVPSSFRPTTRYSREPRIMDGRWKEPKIKPWPKPPKYDPRPRKKNVSTECEILRMVETLDIGTQNVPIQKTTPSQATAWMTNSSTQYPRIRQKEKGIQAPGVKTKETAVQSAPIMKNKFVETPLNALYYPHLMVTETVGTQCSGSYKDHETDAPILHVGQRSTPDPGEYEDNFDSSSSSESSEDEENTVESPKTPTISYPTVSFSDTVHTQETPTISYRPGKRTDTNMGVAFLSVPDEYNGNDFPAVQRYIATADASSDTPTLNYVPVSKSFRDTNIAQTEASIPIRADAH